MLGIERARWGLGLSQEMFAQTVSDHLDKAITADQLERWETGEEPAPEEVKEAIFTVGGKHDDDDEPTCETIEYKGHKVIVRKDYHNTWFVKQIDDKKWLPHLFTEEVHGCMEEATHYIDWLIENEGKAE